MQEEIFNINELFEEWKQFLSWCYENNDKTVEIHRDKLKWVIDYITNLQEELKLSHQDNLELLDYKSRNEKAIEYIKKEEKANPDSNRKDVGLILMNYKKVLNILNGVDKE